jgi:hypothetical protein
MNGMLWISCLSIIMSIGVLASLYFMWDVRRREAE